MPLYLLSNPWGDLWDFPFISGIWGTVVDYAMLIVTFGTFIFLVFNFLQQKKINEDQMHLNNIFRKREIINMRPYFEVKDLEKFSPKAVYATNAVAKNIDVYRTDAKGNWKAENHYMLKEFIQPNDKLFELTEHSIFELPFLTSFAIAFEDELGKKYIQYVETNAGCEITTSFPVELKDKL